MKKIPDIILTRVASDWCIYASDGPWWVYSALFRALSFCSQIVGLPAHPNELRTQKTFGVCRTQMPQCTCIDGPFARTSLALERKRKETFEPTGSFLLLSELSASRPQIANWSVALSRPIFDRSQMVDSTFPTTCTLQCLQTRNSLGERTGSPAHPNDLRQTHKTFGASKIGTLFHRSTLPSSVHA